MKFGDLTAVAALLRAHLQQLPDPRSRLVRTQYSLADLLVMAVVAVMCGADGWPDVADFVRGRADWWIALLRLEPAQVPSESTFRDVLTRIRPDLFFRCFEAFTQGLAEPTTGKVVALDGKSLRGSWKHGLGVVKFVHAWATEQGLLLGVQDVPEGTGELEGLRAVMTHLDLEGSIVTIDAGGAYKPVLHDVRAQKAEYAVGVKGNQPRLHEGIAERFLEVSRGSDDPTMIVQTTEETGHGRRERRTQWTTSAKSVPATRGWPGAQSVIAQRREREVDGIQSIEWRYFLSSIAPEASDKLQQIIRSHWRIENSLHWTLDVAFREDQSRLRDEKGQKLFAVLRRFALTLMTKTPRPRKRIGLARCRKYASWSEEYLAALLFRQKAGD